MEPEPKVQLGQVVCTATVAEAIQVFDGVADAISEYLARHAQGDWGTVDDEDVATNNNALHNAGRLLSAWPPPHERVAEQIWIITEADRSLTTVLFPHDY